MTESTRDAIVLVLEGTGHTPADLILPFVRLDARALLSIRPDEIICALFTAGHDATQVIGRLESLGYGGRITVVAPATLPDVSMVESELRAMGPGARLRLVRRA